MKNLFFLAISPLHYLQWHTLIYCHSFTTCCIAQFRVKGPFLMSLGHHVFMKLHARWYLFYVSVYPFNLLTNLIFLQARGKIAHAYMHMNP